MKKILAFVLVAILMIPALASAESFETFIYSSFTDSFICELGDKLIILADYDQFMGENVESINDFKIDLIKYTSIVWLLTKDGCIYLGIEMPLVEGEFVENTGVPLTTPQYLRDNMRFGS